MSHASSESNQTISEVISDTQYLWYDFENYRNVIREGIRTFLDIQSRHCIFISTLQIRQTFAYKRSKLPTLPPRESFDIPYLQTSNDTSSYYRTVDQLCVHKITIMASFIYNLFSSASFQEVVRKYLLRVWKIFRNFQKMFCISSCIGKKNFENPTLNLERSMLNFQKW